MAMSRQQAACTLARAGWPQDLIPTMVAIGQAESGLEQGAVNRAAEVAAAPPTGWLQVRAFADRAARWNLLDPLQNAQAALAVYQAQGLGAWSTYPRQSAAYLEAASKELAGFDYSSCGQQVKGGSTGGGTGLLRGRQVDPWGIGQGIADAVGYTGSVAGGAGRRLEASGTVLAGVLVLGLGLVILGALFLDTGPGRQVKRAVTGTGAAIGGIVAVAPK
jgi:Lysozyme like domain